MLYVAGDLVYGYVTLHGTYHGGDAVDTFYVVALALFAVAGAAQNAEAAADVRRPIGSTRELGTLRRARVRTLDPAGRKRRRAILPPAERLRDRGGAGGARCGPAAPGAARSSEDAGRAGASVDARRLDRAAQPRARAGPRRADARSRPASRYAATAMYVDLDGFKHVNDTFGHAAGDELLSPSPSGFSSVVRDGDTIGRMGGDEFVVLLEDGTLDGWQRDRRAAASDAIREPVELATSPARRSRCPRASASRIGRGERRRTASRGRLRALRGEGAGQNRYVMFESPMESTANDGSRSNAILRARSTRGVVPALPADVGPATQSVTGVEALVRWQHPTRGVISPAVFIPIAEDSGLIVPIGRWVLREACRQAAAWRREGRQLGLSVNVSARQLDDDDAVSTTSMTRSPPTAWIPRPDPRNHRDRAHARARRAAQRLRRLKALGVRIAIDDFGTGYSSLALPPAVSR